MTHKLLPERTRALREAWRSVKLETLTPLNFAPDQWTALAVGTLHSRSRKFMDALPLPVARVKPEIADELMLVAEGSRGNMHLEDIATAMQRDFRHMASALFRNDPVDKSLWSDPTNESCWRPTIQAKVFSKSKVEYLHIDGKGYSSQQFLCRIGALPFAAINGARYRRANKLEKHWVTCARINSDHQPDAHVRDFGLHQLRAKNILSPADLGTVYLIAAQRPPFRDDTAKGTWHCSAPVTRPTPSVFIRA